MHCNHFANETLGWYGPQRLAIHISKTLATKINKDGGFILEPSEHSQVVIHEHQHYLQDTTTTFGLVSLVGRFQSLLEVVMANSKSDRIHIPLLEFAQTPLMKSCIKLRDVLYGDYEPRPEINAIRDNVPFCESGRSICEVRKISLFPMSQIQFPQPGKPNNPFPAPRCKITVFV